MARPTHQFSQTKRADIPRSSFDLSHGLKTTFDAGFLVPILSLEVLPGDTINCRASLFGRLATPIKPILDNLYLETFFFFTPYRQVWENWTKFNGEQINPGDPIDYVVPHLAVGSVIAEKTIYNYMGLPKGLETDLINVSVLPFRCYNKIYNFWFRNENLIPSRPEIIDDTNEGLSTYKLERRMKRRDYLTSALPWPQKGDEVIVPLGTTAPVIADVSTPNVTDVPLFGPQGLPEEHSLSQSNGVTDLDLTTAANSSGILHWGSQTGLVADLTNATAISINDLRESFQIQKLLERDARGGTRYPEILKSHFQVTDPQLLVHQRPLFLGGGSTMINITPVAQTTDLLDNATGG